jgi:AcrR family transcriptional regulator
MPKIVDRAAYRQELLSQCFDLFAQHGYAAVTMREIAKGLGVSTGTLYHYFPSKESIFNQLVEHLSYEDTTEERFAELGEHPTIRGRIKAIVEFIKKRENYFCKQILVLVDYLQHQDPQTIWSNPALQKAATRYEEAVMRYLNIPDPQLAAFIISAIDGVLIRRLMRGDRISWDAQGEILCSVIGEELKVES